MELSLNQQQKQTLRLAMTPQLQQALRLLQLPTAELEQLVLEEALQNPFLEIPGELDDETESDYTEQSDADAESVESSAGDDALEKTLHTPEESEAHFDEVDVDWSQVYDDSEPPTYTHRDEDENEFSLEERVSARESLHDNLLWQFRLRTTDPRQREIGEYIIGNLDDDGYLRVPIDEIAKATNASPSEVEDVLRIVQSLEPAGVGARSLAECLEIQLRRKRIDDPLPYEIVRKYLPEAQKKNIRKIVQATHTDEEKVREALRIIASLDPRPGYAYGDPVPSYIQPDVIVKKIDDDYFVYVDEGRLAGLRISPRYRKLLEDGSSLSKDERKFASEKFKSALWWLKNLARRNNTLLKVTEAIMQHQRDFLDKGINHLKPLTLRQIADVVGMHESTVARVTNGKYVETPRGIFELKYFFTRGLQSDTGEDTSNATVRQMIADLIKDEDPSEPLSDQKIVDLLKEKGINVARRTVAKYRDQLGILPSRLRKKV